MGSVFEAADGAALLSADALLLVDLIRVVDQAFHVGVSTVVIGRGAPPGCEGAEVCEDPCGSNTVMVTSGLKPKLIPGGSL